MNKFIISGRTTKDLTLEQTTTGVFTTSIPLAENYFYTKDGKKVEATNYFWIDVLYMENRPRTPSDIAAKVPLF